MDDLISRQALLDKFEPWLKVKDYNDGELNMLKAILYEIRFMRSAQPKSGQWIVYTVSPFDGEDVMCSECGQRGCAPYWDYCPHCGAKMEVTE